MPASRGQGQPTGFHRLIGSGVRTPAFHAKPLLLARAFHAGALLAGVRWRYLIRNPAVEAGPNPMPRSEELMAFTRDEVDALEVELGPVFGPLVVFAAETGLRTNEWIALERRDLDRSGPRRVGSAPLRGRDPDPVSEDGRLPAAGAAQSPGA